DTLVRRLGKQRQCRTRDHRLYGCPAGSWEKFEATVPAALAAKYQLSETTARHLVHRYGAHAEKPLEYVLKDQALANPIIEGEPDIRAEFAYQRDYEMAIYPEDFLLRRTRLGLFYPRLLKEGVPGL